MLVNSDEVQGRLLESLLYREELILLKNDVEMLTAYQRYKCIIPLASGGDTRVNNISILCTIDAVTLSFEMHFLRGNIEMRHRV
jgi:hypothetical protein